MNHIIKNILKIFTGTFASRVFGLLRDLTTARFLGTSSVADAFTIALIFPNLFRQILGEDMVERAFMPPFKTLYDQGDKAKAWRYVSIVFNWFFIALLIATVLLYLLLPALFSLKDIFPTLFSAIFSSKTFDFDLTLQLTLILLPFMLFIGLAAFVGSMLNFFDRNWVFGFAPAMLSIGVIVGIYTLTPFIGGYAIAVGYVLGALLQLLIQCPFLFTKKFRRETALRYHRMLSDKSNDFTVIKRESSIITLNAFFNKSSEVFGKFLAIALVQGGVSSLFYAIRLYQLPFGIISLSIVRGINPTLNKMKAEKDNEKFNNLFNKGKILYLVILIPVITVMIIGAEEIVRLVYFRGAFDEKSLYLTSGALIMYSIGLLPMSLTGYYTRVLSLFNKNKYALKISIVSAFSNILCAILLVKMTSLDHRAIALASSIAFVINMLFLQVYISKELNLSWRVKEILLTSVFIVLSIVITLYHEKVFTMGVDSWSDALILLSVKTVVASVVFLPVIILMKKKFL